MKEGKITTVRPWSRGDRMRTSLWVEGFHLERTMDSSSMVFWASMTEYHRPGWLISLEIGKFKIKMPGDSMSGEDLLSGSQTAPSYFVLTR